MYYFWNCGKNTFVGNLKTGGLGSLYLEHSIEAFGKGIKVCPRLGEAGALLGAALLELAPEDLGAQQGKDPQEQEQEYQQGHCGTNFISFLRKGPWRGKIYFIKPW